MPTFASDYAFGTANEIAQLASIEEHLKTRLIHRKGNASFDYDNGKDIYADLKTRRIKHDDYPTALIGGNKVEKALSNENAEHWFFYNYTDGLFAVKYDKEKFAKYSRRMYKRGNRDDYHNRAADTYFIPCEDLVRVSA